MHYEESVIDGILHSRTAYTGVWVALDVYELTRRYTKMKADLQRLQSTDANDTAADAAIKNTASADNIVVAQAAKLTALTQRADKLQRENDILVKRCADNVIAVLGVYEAVAKGMHTEDVYNV